MNEEETLLLEAGQSCFDDVISTPYPNDGQLSINLIWVHTLA